MTEYAWGLDVSTKRVALAVYNGDRFDHWPTISFPSTLKGARRLAYACEVMRPWLFDASHWTPPFSAFIEQPAASIRNAPLDHMVGCVLAMVATVTTAPVLTLPVSRWKALACGAGGASKLAVMDWARELGYQGTDQDEADALGVAVAGHALLERKLGTAA